MEPEGGNVSKGLSPDINRVWEDFPTYLGSPPFPAFHGFGTEEDIPGRFMIKTVLVDGEEVLKGIYREKRGGRPRGVSKFPEVSRFAGKKDKPRPVLRNPRSPPKVQS